MIYATFLHSYMHHIYTHTCIARVGISGGIFSEITGRNLVGKVIP